jgi:hypothetical protein
MGQGCECGSCEEWGLISQDVRQDRIELGVSEMK